MANVKIKDLEYGIHFRFIDVSNESGISTTRIDDVITYLNHPDKSSISVGDTLKIEGHEYDVKNICIENIYEFPYDPNLGLDLYGHEKLDRKALMCIRIEVEKL